MRAHLGRSGVAGPVKMGTLGLTQRPINESLAGDCAGVPASAHGSATPTNSSSLMRNEETGIAVQGATLTQASNLGFPIRGTPASAQGSVIPAGTTELQRSVLVPGDALVQSTEEQICCALEPSPLDEIEPMVWKLTGPDA